VSVECVCFLVGEEQILGKSELRSFVEVVYGFRVRDTATSTLNCRSFNGVPDLGRNIKDSTKLVILDRRIWKLKVTDCGILANILDPERIIRA
jgi:hypothetical protein